jgi:hypothetical protein
MTPRSDALFHRVGTVTLTRSDGSQVQGFGAVIPWGEERSDLWRERSHPLGKLTAPLYRFVGSFPELLDARGAKLTQGDQSYRVLLPETVTLAGKRVFERALLERWESDDGN